MLICLGVIFVAASLAEYANGGSLSCAPLYPQPVGNPWPYDPAPCDFSPPQVFPAEWLVFGVLLVGFGAWLQLAAAQARAYLDGIYRRAIQRLGPIELP